MKKLYFLFLLVVSIPLAAQPTVELSGTWLFRTGDDMQYAKPDYNDRDWETITVPSQWETQGHPGLDGFGWYRLHFSCNKKIADKELTMLLGKIDDVDEVFLNGTRIGGSGKFPPNPASEWNLQRVYPFAASLLRKDNILAIRVFDMGAPGGIIGGDFGIYTKAALKVYLNVDGKPVRSYHKLTTSNGLTAAVYDAKLNTITGVYPHIFQMIDAKTPVRAFINNLKTNISGAPVKTGYLANTHIILSEYKKQNVYYFASFLSDKPVFYVVFEAKNHDLIKDASCNFKPMPGLITDTITVYHAPYYRKVFLYAMSDSLQDNQENVSACKALVKNAPGFIEQEAGYMLGIFAKSKMPDGISADEKNILEQSIAVLKMSQVSQSEVYPKGRGQILASLPPGEWNISWIRDGSYSLLALTKLGLFEEARNYVKFLLGADCGYYKSYIHTDGKDYGIGSDYSISVCRYFGNGTEESDFNDQGPNVELDGFGLFLHSFSEYTIASGDSVVLFTALKKIKNTVADVLLKMIDGNGLIRKDSGPWERHLPGKQVAYTSITAAKGLSAFGNLLKKYHRSDYQRYLDASDAILEAIKQRLLVNGVFKGTYEAKTPDDLEYYDASTFELFNFFPQEFKSYFPEHHTALSRVLSITKDRGMKRINGGDWYDNQEWIFLDCRLINCLNEFGKVKEASTLRKWIVNQAVLNNNLIPELYSQANAKYEGAIPMVGFGAGSFILTYFK